MEFRDILSYLSMGIVILALCNPRLWADVKDNLSSLRSRKRPPNDKEQ